MGLDSTRIGFVCSHNLFPVIRDIFVNVATTSTPALPPRRLVTVIKEKTNRCSFCQLDGEAREEPTKPEGEGEVKASDGRQELLCHCLDHPNYEYDPNNDEDRYLIWTPPES